MVGSARSHNREVASAEPLASHRPSSLKTAEFTAAPCPFKAIGSLRDPVRSHNRTFDPEKLPIASQWLSGLRPSVLIHPPLLLYVPRTCCGGFSCVRSHTSATEPYAAARRVSSALKAMARRESSSRAVAWE